MASVCYLTTTGRRTGRPHRIEIWYVEVDGAIYLLSGGGATSDWVRNLAVHPGVQVEFPGDAEVAASTLECLGDIGPFADEQAVREAIDGKYHDWHPGTPLSNWATASLLVRLVPVGTD